jgi:hypothetical protein
MSATGSLTKRVCTRLFLGLKNNICKGIIGLK